MDLPKPANSDTNLLNKPKQPNTTRMKGVQNELKIISVTSKFSHWDLRLKYGKQDNYVQEHPDLEADMQEYTEEDNHFEEYRNLQKYTETYMQEYTEGQPAELDTPYQHNEVKNKMTEELDPNDNFVKEEVPSDLDIAEENYLNNDTEPKDNFFNVNIKVKKEFRGTELGYGEVDEVTKINEKVGDIPKDNRVDRVLNHYENVDKVLKHFETIKCIQESDGKVDGVLKSSENDVVMNNVTSADEFAMLKCTVCFKAFLGDDAYNEHMKKHTTKTSRGKRKQSSGVLKDGKPLSSKWAIVKVKKVRPKRLQARNKEDEGNTIKLNNTQNHSVSANIVDSNTVKNDSVSSQNNSNSDSNTVQNDIDIDSTTVKIEIDYDGSNTVKVDDDNDNSTVEVDAHNDNNAVKIEVDNDSNVVNENKDLLVEIPGKSKIIKLIEKNSKRRFRKHIMVTYRKCDENCTNDEFCTQSKECRRKQRLKKNIITPYECLLCNYKSNFKTRLEAHMLTHNSVKSFCCNICEYKCVQRCHLDQHMRTHSGTKPYSCKYCDYECVQQSQLEQHVRTHTRVKPFSCNFCDYSCKQRCHLDQHMRRHTGVMPFSCTFCDYKSVQQSHLNQHIMKMHKNVHVFKCHHCRYRCLQLDMLAKHMKTHSVDTA